MFFKVIQFEQNVILTSKSLQKCIFCGVVIQIFLRNHHINCYYELITTQEPSYTYMIDWLIGYCFTPHHHTCMHKISNCYLCLLTTQEPLYTCMMWISNCYHDLWNNRNLHITVWCGYYIVYCGATQFYQTIIWWIVMPLSIHGTIILFDTIW